MKASRFKEALPFRRQSRGQLWVQRTPGAAEAPAPRPEHSRAPTLDVSPQSFGNQQKASVPWSPPRGIPFQNAGTLLRGGPEGNRLGQEDKFA